MRESTTTSTVVIAVVLVLCRFFLFNAVVAGELMRHMIYIPAVGRAMWCVGQSTNIFVLSHRKIQLTLIGRNGGITTTTTINIAG